MEISAFLQRAQYLHCVCTVAVTCENATESPENIYLKKKKR